MMLQNFKPANELIMTFYVMMPKSWSKKKKTQLVGTPMQSKADIDNIVKGVMDSILQKDETVWKICASKRWAYAGQIIVKNWEKDISIK
jgi:Holliday junction resolvase RusA-like endonuclease